MSTVVETPLASHFSRLNELPSLSTLLLEALELLNSGYDAHELAEKIGRDPAMTAKILRIANSPFYGRARQIASLTDAIVLLGRNQIGDLLLSVCFTNLIPTKIENIDYLFFWHHSIAVADCTRKLALVCDIEAEMAFTVGLLHDIGRLIMITLYTEQYRVLFDDSSLALHNLGEQEHALLGFDHAQIGGQVAKLWNFPAKIQKAIEQHEYAPSPGVPVSLSALIYTANLLVYQVQQAGNANQALQRTIMDALELLAVSTEQASRIAQDSLKYADHITALL
jgi:putative nucleotidyltransferase with HDIG domain